MVKREQQLCEKSGARNKQGTGLLAHGGGSTSIVLITFDMHSLMSTAKKKIELGITSIDYWENPSGRPGCMLSERGTKL